MIKDENKKKLTEELIDIFEKAKNEFLEKEKAIIKNDTNERTLTQRLAFYLELQLRKNIKYENYSVDCEYNRKEEDIKRLKFGKNTDKKEIYPDIIVHQRKIKNNLIAIEMKKTTSRNTDKIKDIEKLEALTDRKNDYHYTLGIYFELDITDNNNIINFFVDGEVI
ncbi:hypothetical protein LDK20_07760 [Fusobacterium nucleatum]|uniref:Type I restriction enzyme R protein N-terminal domain-containing protein n=1 Tax=Fusobacterium animalis 7_1 TaxID=457405 RepID=A0A140PRN2_9FUSO|nr:MULTISPECIES: hypothetical protein [Fusobacterium]ASG31599.1 hypothetical protein CBG60_10590 [Fusobacterium animalis]EEO42421.1 hypothetical protein FSDG_00980 [Fusobacterium animalis 7_1]EPC07907.1 hypothetical protein HMPREF9369_02715 [Fusobacterium polymorphum F0401]ERT40755.1 hypothetical protein HMPREF1538_01237 [Fusobacterium nucleatum CTI-1]BEO89303.1 hypothetical protein FNCA3_06310 [Fusobacterium nucleatum]